MVDKNINIDIYPIWKPKNITSSEVVRHIKKIYNLEKAGHCGTLDPFAEGVIIVLSNDKTKESEKYMNDIKVYETTILLGSQTDTLDPTGTILRQREIKLNTITEEKIREKLKKFIGNIKQRPPCFSAKRINGVRLYKLARKDVFVYLKPVNVHIEAIDLISYSEDEIAIEVVCHKGVYIRQLGIDIANSLGTIGYLKSLTRKSIGEFNQNNSIKFETLIN